MSIAAISVIWVSCGKENIDSPAIESINTQDTKSYTIPKDHLEKELQALMEGREKGNFQYNKAKIKYLLASNEYEIIIADRDDIPTVVVCQGSGYSFASCVGNWLEANPDLCLVITYDSSSGDYSADDDC